MTSTAAVATAEPSWVARSRLEAPHATGDETGAEGVAAAGRLDRLGLRDGDDRDGLGVGLPDEDALGRPGGDPGADAGEHLVDVPAGLLLEQVRLVLVGEQEVGAVDEVADHLAVRPGQLLAGVGGERVALLAALLGVPHHRLRVVGADHHEVELADPVRHGAELDVAGLRHRARVERRDLVVGRVGRADEAGGVLELGPVHALRCRRRAARSQASYSAKSLPTAPTRTGCEAQQAQPVGDVRARAAPVLHEVVDEEGQRDVLHLPLDELLDELPREGHQVVGGDGAGDGDGHGALPLEWIGGTAAR